LTPSVVGRWAIFLERDSFGELQTSREWITIALVRCDFCKARVRLLPCDVLPHKQYTVTAIEFALVAYCGDRQAPFPMSLRKVVFSFLGERTPTHTSLHGWTEGLGAFAAGRAVGALPGAIPADWLLATSEALLPGLKAMRGVAVAPEVPLWRYRQSIGGAEKALRDEGGAARRERLQHLFLYIECAAFAVAASKPPDLLMRLGQFVQKRVQQPPWQLKFRSSLGCTGFEHFRARGSRDCRCRQRKERHRCLMRGRSPPGSTN
jgi:hypothetical protein